MNGLFAGVGQGIGQLASYGGPQTSPGPSPWVDPWVFKMRKVENGYILYVRDKEYVIDNIDKVTAILVASEFTK